MSTPTPSATPPTTAPATGALNTLREAFRRCFQPDFNGFDWRDDDAVQRFAQTASRVLFPRPDERPTGGPKLTDDESETLMEAFGFHFNEPGDHERFAAAIEKVETILTERVEQAVAERHDAVMRLLEQHERLAGVEFLGVPFPPAVTLVDLRTALGLTTVTQTGETD